MKFTPIIFEHTHLSTPHYSYGLRVAGELAYHVPCRLDYGSAEKLAREWAERMNGGSF